MTMPEQKKAVTPRLRFPEFRDAGPWEYRKLERHLEPYNERVPASGCNLPIYTSSRDGLISQKDYFDGRELINEGEYGVVPPGYFVYRHMSDDATFKFNLNNTGGSIAVSKEYPVFTTHAVVDLFLLFLLNEGEHFKRFAATQRKGGTRTRLYFATLCSCSLPMPSIPEQQKIADCLSSLDELIELQAKQLEALQAHKKGLMQQLFPREGETTPRLRFPEFRDAGPWENIQVLDFGTIVTGKTPSTSNPKYWNGRFAWVTPTDISDTKYIYTTDRLLTSEGVQLIGVLPENTVLITCIASIGKNAILKVPGSCNQQINAIIPNSNFNSDFIYYLFCKNQIILQNQAGTSATAIIPKSAFEKLYFHVPKLPEQQKIADCLSSLDELIELQAKKLEALQTHKKGLMQQLFPAGD
jgi:type I restriction enzyme S subunit